MRTTDRLANGGHRSFEPDEAMSVYTQRLQELEYEVDLIRSAPMTFSRELAVVANRVILPHQFEVVSTLPNLAVARVAAETVAAVYDIEASQEWMDAEMNDVAKSRMAYALTEPIDLLTSDESEITGDLERFFF